MNDPQGIYTGASESDFKDIREIKAEQSPIRKEWDNPFDKLSFDDMIEEATRRAEWRKEFDRIPEVAEVTIYSEKPIAVCVLSDQHLGSKETDYDYYQYVIETIKYNDNAFAVLGGDFLNLLSWNPGQNEDILNFEEQYVTMYKSLYEIKDKVIAGVKGNHRWQNKKGVDQYMEFLTTMDCPLFDNLGYLYLKVTPDDTYENPPVYNMVLAHKLKGLSYMNDNHPQGRFSRETEGADIIVSCHTHDGANQSTSKSLFGGGRKPLTFVNGKTFKKNDGFLRGEGETNFDVGANWLYLNPYTKRHMAIPTTELAYEVMDWKLD